MKTPLRTQIGLEHFSYPDQFGSWLGYKHISVDRRRQSAVIGLLIRNDHLSPSGRVHGGVISASFDAALGAAIFTTLEPRDFSATVELKVNYFRPLVEGDRVRIETQVVFRGRRLAVAHGLLYINGERKPAAMATGTFTIVSEARPGIGPARHGEKAGTKSRAKKGTRRRPG